MPSSDPQFCIQMMMIFPIQPGVHGWDHGSAGQDREAQSVWPGGRTVRTRCYVGCRGSTPFNRKSYTPFTQPCPVNRRLFILASSHPHWGIMASLPDISAHLGASCTSSHLGASLPIISSSVSSRFFHSRSDLQAFCSSSHSCPGISA